MRVAIVLVALVASVTADSPAERAPVVVPFTAYPYLVSLLRNNGAGAYNHHCSGSIVNNRSFLTSARCVANTNAATWRGRVGSATVNQGGVVHAISLILTVGFDDWSMINDIAMLRVTGSIVFNNYVQPGSFAGPNYIVHDNDAVTSVGWGYLGMPGWTPVAYSATRAFQAAAVNLNFCRNYYQGHGVYIQYSMLCSGFLQPGSVAAIRARDKCFGEPGAPLVHVNAIVGIRSWAVSCYNPNAPAVSTRVSNYAAWIQANA